MKKTLLSLMLTVSSCAAFAQWTQLPQDGGELRDLTIVPGGLLAASDGGVFKSTDGGNTWVYSSNGLFAADSSISCEHFASTATALFVQTSNGIAKSTNNGSSWVSAGNAGLSSSMGNFSSLISVGNTLYTCQYTNMNTYQIFSSTNDGASWTAGANVYSNNNRPLLFNKGGVIYVTKTDSIFTTTGASLTPMSYTGFPVTGSIIGNLSSDGTYLYAGFDNGGGGFYRYDIANTNWQQITTGMPSFIYSSGPTLIGSTLYASILTMSMTIQTYTSTNQGSSWGQTTLSGMTTDFIDKIYSLGGSNLFAYNPVDGLATSSNNGASWAVHNTGFKSVVFRDQRNLVYSNGNLVVSGDLGLQKSGDAGNTWAPAMNGMPSTLFLNYGLYNANNTLYSSFMDVAGKYLYKSIDGGANWSAATYPAGNNDIEFWSHSNTAVFAKANNNSLYRSINSGGAWTDITSNLPGGYSYNTPIISDGTNSYIVGQSGSGAQVWYSNDDGTSWNPFSMSGTPAALGGYLADNIFMNGSALMSFWLDASSFPFTYKMCTWNAGTWSSVSTTGLPPNLISTCSNCGNNGTYTTQWFTYASNIYYMSYRGLYMSTDNGVTFSAYNNGFYPGVNTKRLATDGVKLFAGTEGNSIWSALAPLGVQEHLTSDVLADIYPNPATNLVVVSYNEEFGKNGKLIITDMLGAIVQETNLVSGTTHMEVSTSHLKSGVYFYSIQTASKKSETKKLVISK